MSVLWILGEARSGKSELAEAIFARLPGMKYYIATLLRTPQWLDTIAKHVRQRPAEWETLEITDRLDAATERIASVATHEPVGVLLDGWGVYVERKAVEWDSQNPGVTLAAEDPFVEEMHEEFRRLTRVCHYLVMVDHIAPYAPTTVDYEANRVRWRIRAVVSRCLADGGRIVYHDREDVSHTDQAYAERVAREMVAFEQGASDR